jgi:hypothetical protein
MTYQSRFADRSGNPWSSPPGAWGVGLGRRIHEQLNRRSHGEDERCPTEQQPFWRPRRDSNPQPPDSKNYAWPSMASVEKQPICTGTAPELHRRSTRWFIRSGAREGGLSSRWAWAMRRDGYGDAGRLRNGTASSLVATGRHRAVAVPEQATVPRQADPAAVPSGSSPPVRPRRPGWRSRRPRPSSRHRHRHRR